VIPQVRAAAEQAAQAAGRDPRTIGLVVGAVTVVDRDGAAARALARRKAALYLPIIAQLDRTLDLDPALLERIEAAAAAYDFDLAGSYISDTLLRKLAFAGTPGEVAEQAIELYNAGVTRVEFGTPHGLSEAEGLRLLGEDVLPTLKSSGVLG
jgi:5,10-methylenetetrahydromethanopterin reductase